MLSLDPQYLGDVLEDVRRVGRATGADAVADDVTARMQERIDAVAQRSQMAGSHPRVLHLEWTDPLMCGGHWVPEMVELAGGENYVMVAMATMGIRRMRSAIQPMGAAPSM